MEQRPKQLKMKTLSQYAWIPGWIVLAELPAAVELGPVLVSKLPVAVMCEMCKNILACHR